VLEEGHCLLVPESGQLPLMLEDCPTYFEVK